LEQQRKRNVLVMTALAILMSACGQVQPSPATTAPEAPVDVSTATPPPATRTPAPTATATAEPTSTTTPVPRVSVSANTNCRSGPSASYVVLGALEIGQVAEVTGRSIEPGYWYVTGANLPEEGCWLWGEYARVDGEIERLPVFTPAPSPTPYVGFDLYLKSFERCGDTLYVVFAVKNVGGKRLWSGYITVEDFSTHQILHQRTERHPFAATVLPVCPPDHGNELWPGETRYIHADLSHVTSGNTAIGSITLCTADFQGDYCLTEYSYFELP
jgi:hypothetical protein